MTDLPPVLLVDDEPDDVFILKRLLLRAGIQNKVISFEDSNTAVAFLEGESVHPDSPYLPWIIFTDLNMPRLDGIEFTKYIRSLPRLKTLTIVMVTSSEQPSDRHKAEAAGVNRFMLKYPSVGMLQTLASEFQPAEAKRPSA